MVQTLLMHAVKPEAQMVVISECLECHTHQQLDMPRVFCRLLGCQLQFTLLHRIEGGLELTTFAGLVIEELGEWRGRRHTCICEMGVILYRRQSVR